jgi:signal peptidase I
VIADGIRIALQRPGADAPPASTLRWLHLPALVVASIALALGLRMFVVEAFKIPSAGMVPSLQIGDHALADKLGMRMDGPRLGDMIVFRNPCTPEKDFVKRVVAMPGDTVEVRCDRLYVDGAPVRSEVVSGPCAYDDFDEARRTWVKADCQRRRERLGDATYDVVLSPDAAVDHAGAHDFPGAEHEFACIVDRRSDEERSRAAGQVVAVTGAPPADACAPRAHFVVPAGHVFTMGDNRHNSSDSRTWGPVPLDHVKGRISRIWWSMGPGDTIRWDRLGEID